MKKLFILALLCMPFHLYAETEAKTITIDTILESNPPRIFLVADKQAGKIYYYDKEAGGAVSAPALYGKLTSDIYDNEYYDSKQSPPSYITPTGVFKLRKYMTAQLSTPLESMQVYVPGKEVVLAIHRVYRKSPGQRRLDRLASPTPTDNKISNGCINVPDDFYNKYIENIPTGTLLYVLPETRAGIEKFLEDIRINGEKL
jgi:hypothetical protein